MPAPFFSRDYVRKNAASLCNAGGLAVALCNAHPTKVPHKELLNTADDLGAAIKTIERSRRSGKQMRDLDRLV